MSTIVVGLDGSEGSVKALRFAIEEARIRGGEVKAVCAWHVPPIAYEGGWVPSPLDIEDFPKSAQAALDKNIAEVAAGESGVEVTPVVREGLAAEVLVAEARGADLLLVVGSRGLGGFRGLLLGSVSQQCAHHAPCPVAIVPLHKTPDKS